MDMQQVNELLLQSLEQEIGGIKVYETALKCAINDDLREEWKKYLEQTRNHERILRGVCKALDVDAAKETAGRTILRSLGGALVDAMETSLAAGKREAAELVACECVVLAETKDHFDWELIGKCAENLGGEAAKVLAAAYERSRGSRGRARLSHQRLVPRAVATIARPRGGAAPSRGAPARKDRDRRGESRTSSRNDDLRTIT